MAGSLLYVGTYERAYPRNQQIIRLARDAGWSVEEIHEPVLDDVQDKTRGIRTAFGVLSIAVRLLLAYCTLIIRLLVRLPRTQAVVVGYIGQFDMLALGSIARLFGKPVLFNPLVSLTDTLVEDRGIVGSRSPGSFAIKLIDRLSLSIASHVIVDTDENGRYLEERFGLDPERWTVIPVGADESVFRHVPRTSTTTDSRRIHVLFYGKMIPLHGIDVILEAIEELQDDAAYSFEVIGSGQLQDRVEQFVSTSAVDTFIYRPWVAYHRLPQRIACADIVLGVFGAGDKAARVIPNKVFQAMAVGSAIITRDSPAIRRVLAHNESAFLVAPGDAQALVAAIRELRDPVLRDRLAQNARAAFERFGADSMVRQQLHRVLTRLISGQQAI